MSAVKSVGFEIYGKVQGVYFRDNTVRKALELGLKGNVRNRKSGTVAGIIQGPQDAVEEMKLWLSRTGSPKCRIDEAKFSAEEDWQEYEDFERLPTTD